MSRVNLSVASRARRKSVLKAAKGFIGRRKSCYKLAKRSVDKSLQHAYKGRKQKKRDMRAQFISRVSALAEMIGFKYSVFVFKCKQADIQINKKTIALLSSDKNTSDAFVNYVKSKII